MNTKSCSRDCPERRMGCHAGCPNYAEMVRANEQRKAAERRENAVNVAASQIQYYGLKQSMKRRHIK